MVAAGQGGEKKEEGGKKKLKRHLEAAKHTFVLNFAIVVRIDLLHNLFQQLVGILQSCLVRAHASRVSEQSSRACRKRQYGWMQAHGDQCA